MDTDRNYTIRSRKILDLIRTICNVIVILTFELIHQNMDALIRRSPQARVIIEFLYILSINEYGNGFQQSFHAGVSAGFQFFDTTLNKPIWWTGTKWVDATGADV